MKAIYTQTKLILLGISLLALTKLDAQYSWTQKANFTGAARFYSAGFSIGKNGYIGCGNSNNSSFFSDFYKWNQTTNTWSAIASYPGAGYEYSPVSFSIEGSGYVGFGWTGSGGATDFWRYDTATNTWTAMATFPGTGRYDESVFVIGHKAWVIGGSTGGPPYLEDVWMYDAHTNTWTQKNNSPAGKTDAGFAFSIGNQGFIGGGDDGSSSYNLCWKYDTASDTWTSITAFPISLAPTGDSRAFVLGDTGYVCTGTIDFSNTLPTGYSYNPTTNAWTEFTNMGAIGIERGYCAAFTIGNCGYIGTGKDSLGNMLTSFWQWGPPITGDGVHEISEPTSNILVYPNPSNGTMNLVYNGNIQDGELQITDLMGRVLDSYKMTGSKGQITINETSLSSGMYFYRSLDSGNLVTSGKFIIAK